MKFLNTDRDVVQDGDLEINKYIQAEDAKNLAQWRKVALFKLQKLSLRDLASLAKKLKVYEKAAEQIGMGLESKQYQHEMIINVLIERILYVDNYVAALADHAEDDYVFPS